MEVGEKVQSDLNNMELWDKVRTPDPKYTKNFNRGGGFKGTSTNAQYLIQVATEQFGPNGVGWGLKITKEDYINGAYLNDKETSVIHVVRGYVWYTYEGKTRKTSEQFGQTTFVGKNKNGTFTDEEAPKKSVTDLMAKCLSLIGFAADIFLGLWDNNKYVAEVTKQATAKAGQASKEETSRELLEKIEKWLEEKLKNGMTCEEIDLIWKNKIEPRKEEFVDVDWKAISIIRKETIAAIKEDLKAQS